jgi:hypothetical protein
MKQPAKRANKALQTKIGKAIPRSAKTDFSPGGSSKNRPEADG